MGIGSRNLVCAPSRFSSSRCPSYTTQYRRHAASRFPLPNSKATIQLARRRSTHHGQREHCSQPSHDAWGREQVDTFDWAMRFEERVRELLLTGTHDPLIAYETLGRDAVMSVPTPDHYLPLLYVIAQIRDGERIGFPVEGFDGGSVSMLSVQIG